MKTIWTLITTIALANMLALVGIVGWLRTSQRLDGERLRQVRELFTETVEARDTRAAEAAKAKEDQAKAEEASARAKEPPVTAAQKLQWRLEEAEADKARAERLRQEAAQLQATIARQIKDLELARASLQAERTAYEELREKHRQLDGSAQFKKSLATLEGLAPAQVKAILEQMLKAGQAEDSEQAISFLNGMQERTRVKVIDEFAKQDPALASDLLARLRTRGLVAQAASPPTTTPVSGKP
jgi:DNA repair exonuclease SbcCD ATPase subunit